MSCYIEASLSKDSLNCIQCEDNACLSIPNKTRALLANNMGKGSYMSIQIQGENAQFTKQKLA